MSFVLQTLSSLWEIVVFGILLGAGLPAVFALGLKALSPQTALAPVSSSGTAPMAQIGAGRKVLSGVCFAIVIVAVVIAIVYLIVTGHR